MQITGKEDEEIFEKIKKIKHGDCPNFYITGNSISSIENLGIKLAKAVKDYNLINYKGIVTYFTINMPYYDDNEKAGVFISRLKDSVSIARDCYDSYCGTVLIEMSEEWSKKGYNPALEIFLDYIQKEKKIHFIILIPLIKYHNNEKILFMEFTRCGIWLKINSYAPTVEQCINLFEDKAKKQGYRVSQNAKQILEDKLKTRDVLKTDNIKIVQQLIKQIVFNKSIQQNKNNVIDTEDIDFVAGIEKNTENKRIGFSANIR